MIEWDVASLNDFRGRHLTASRVSVHQLYRLETRVVPTASLRHLHGQSLHRCSLGLVRLALGIGIGVGVGV